jgi:fumarate reductase flavoprotein subunit
MTYDLVVVGAGSAGLTCAIAAGSQGARVLLLDAADDVGGTLHVSGGHLSGGGTAAQRRAGIVDSPADHYADVLRISPQLARRDLLRHACDLAPGLIDWLTEDLGLELADDCPRLVYGHEPYRIPRTVYGHDEARSILAVLRPALDELVADGVVDLRLGTSVDALEVDAGRVAGVHAAGRAQLAAATVLTTGGYGSSPELFAELERAPLVSAAWTTSAGDGLRLGRSIGSALQGHGMFLPAFGGLPPPDGGTRVHWDDRPLLTVERPPWEIYVDAAGRRWVAEDEPSIDAKERALATVPEMTFWTVFDSRALRESHPMVVSWSREDLVARAGVRPGVHVASTPAELACAAGIDVDGLTATVTAYNAAVEAGVDSAFGRRFLPAPIIEAPYYAMRNHGVTLVTFVGLDVDDTLAVRRGDGSVIPGLYAAGEVIGAAATNGNAFCGGMILTPALAFGRWLGARLAG